MDNYIYHYNIKAVGGQNTDIHATPKYSQRIVFRWQASHKPSLLSTTVKLFIGASEVVPVFQPVDQSF